VLGYVSISEEASVKLMELIGNVYSVGLDRVLVVQTMITTDLVWENIGKELNESSKIIYC
jgi:hypothetical protein